MVSVGLGTCVRINNYGNENVEGDKDDKDVESE